MINLSIRLALLLALSWTGSAALFAAEDRAAEDKTEQAKDNVSTETKVSNPIQSDEKNSPQASTGTTKKKKNLNEAFEKFIPSEIISADNAVPFPVDI